MLATSRGGVPLARSLIAASIFSASAASDDHRPVPVAVQRLIRPSCALGSEFSPPRLSRQKSEKRFCHLRSPCRCPRPATGTRCPAVPILEQFRSDGRGSARACRISTPPVHPPLGRMRVHREAPVDPHGHRMCDRRRCVRTPQPGGQRFMRIESRRSAVSTDNSVLIIK
jgi:hypothetical protein